MDDAKQKPDADNGCDERDKADCPWAFPLGPPPE
jgi:hypothetical protein